MHAHTCLWWEHAQCLWFCIRNLTKHHPLVFPMAAVPFSCPARQLWRGHSYHTQHCSGAAGGTWLILAYFTSPFTKQLVKDRVFDDWMAKTFKTPWPLATYLLWKSPWLPNWEPLYSIWKRSSSMPMTSPFLRAKCSLRFSSHAKLHNHHQ